MPDYKAPDPECNTPGESSRGLGMLPATGASFVNASPTPARGGSPASLRWWQRWQATLLGAFLFVALVVLVAQVADVARDYEQARNAALDKQQDTAVALARATRLFVDRHLMGAQVVAEALALQGAPHAAALRPLLARLREAHPEAAAFALDPGGRVVASVPEGREGEDRSGRLYMEAFAAGASSVVATLRLDTPAIVVGAAARGPGGTLAGVVATMLPARALGDELSVQLSGGAQALVVDRDGFVLVHGGHPEIDRSRRDFSSVLIVGEALAGRPARSRGFPSPLTGESRIGAMVPVAGVGWAAGVLEPTAMALAPARREVTAAIWVAALVLVLSLAMALVLSTWLGRPIERLAAAVAAVASGDLGHRVPVRGRNEVGWLAERFNDMAARLTEMTRRLNAALEEARADRGRLTTTLESIPDGVLVCDAEGRLVLANEAARRMLGDGFAAGAWLDEMDGDPETRTLAGDPVPAERLPLRRALAGEPTHDLRLVVTRAGETRYLSATAAPVESGSGTRLGAVAVVRDITGQQALEALKDQFIARASHELRTPLTAIRGTLGFLRRLAGGRLEQTSQELLAIAGRSADQMFRLVEDLLDASRLTAASLRLEPESLDAAAVLGETVRLFRPAADEAGVVVRLAVEPGLRIEADPVKLDQVLANLLGNAVKFTPSGGSVEVSARGVDGAVEIRVSDRGVGLAREHLERVFEPFFQVDRAGGRVRPRGTGLGLTIARSLVELHGGRVWAESDGRGRGSTFVARLPACPHVGVARAPLPVTS